MEKKIHDLMQKTVTILEMKVQTSESTCYHLKSHTATKNTAIEPRNNSGCIIDIIDSGFGKLYKIWYFLVHKSVQRSIIVRTAEKAYDKCVTVICLYR